jgi:hypothetical protein
MECQRPDPEIHVRLPDNGRLRKSLGHPLDRTKTVRCIVLGVFGMDAASAPERRLVVSRFWAEGISAEYIPQSGILMSLLKRHGKSWSQ